LRGKITQQGAINCYKLISSRCCNCKTFERKTAAPIDYLVCLLS